MLPAASKEIKTAVLGFGLAGRVFHAPFIHAVPGLELSAIVQRRGDEAARAYPGVTILRTVEEALASDAELLVVGTPNETHYDLAKQCLEAGKHVVVDKPHVSTSEEALALAKLAAEKNLLLAPFQNRRWDGDFLTIKALLLQHTLGRLTTFESHFDRYRPIPRDGHGRSPAIRPTECSSILGRTWSIRRWRSSGPRSPSRQACAQTATDRRSRTPSTSRCTIRGCWRAAAQP